MTIDRTEFRIECIEEQETQITVNSELLKQYQCNFLLLIQEKNQEIIVTYVSRSNRIRAVEILDYIMSEFGLVKGSAKWAQGIISTTILKAEMVEREVKDIKEYFAWAVDDYLENTICIVAKAYAQNHEKQLKQLPLYQKKKITWAFVKSTDVACPGQQLSMKTLENESGSIITADTDVYIMIGCKGEVYEIDRHKFESTYEKTNQKLDVFEQMLDFIPEIYNISSGEYVCIDELANLCYPKQSVQIYIQRLEQRTKIFQGEGTGDYFLGMPGDYMAVRSDDIEDIYVIKKDILEQTYEKVANE